MSVIKFSILLKIFIIFNIIFNSFASSNSNNNNNSNNNLSKDELNIYKEMIRDYYRPSGEVTYYGNFDDKNKRAINRYKSFILARGNVDSMEDEEESNEMMEYIPFPRIMPKRIPGAILSWAIPTTNRVKVFNTNYRPPGISRPAA